MLKWCACRLASFRPHIHTASCTVCRAAPASLSFPSSPLAPPKHVDLHEEDGLLEKTVVRDDILSALTFDNQVVHTVEEMKEMAFRRWLQLTEPTPRGTDKDEAKRLYDAYLQHPEAATRETIEGAARYLDTFCRRAEGLGRDTTHASPSPTEDHVLSFSANFSLPYRTAARGGAAQSDLDTSRNDFTTFLKEAGMTPKDIAHQQKFQSALLAFQQVLVNKTQLPFFLSCGTALGARRERYFIPHDDDIDIGILYEKSVVLGSSCADVKEEARQFAQNPFSAHCISRASQSVSQLLADLTFGGAFVIFDICGTVEMGLEVRLLHAATGVRIDVNWYYPPLPDGHDAALVAQRGDFLWSATYYEQADQRRHGMYRYLHTSLLEKEDPLEPLAFCARHATDPSLSFMTPKEAYLVECFGDDWRVPRAYSYAEGLGGEFTNIIKE